MSTDLAGLPRHPQADRMYLLEEKQRPGELLPIFEDEHGTYIMNSRDLRAVEHVHRLVAIGVDCLKIEGRTKSHYYTARTTQVYRRAIDDASQGHAFNPALLAELESLAHRGYTDGFYQRHASKELQNYRHGSSRNQRQLFVAEVTGMDQTSGLSRLDVKNKFRLGDRLELMTPGGNHSFRLEIMADKHAHPIEEAPGGGYQVLAKLPVSGLPHGLLCRYLDSA
jgi:putative protease